MQYHDIPIGDRDTHYYHVPEESYALEKQPELNRNDVHLIKVHDCPIMESCVYVDDKNITAFCRHMGSYGCVIEDEHSLKALPCSFNGRPVERTVNILAVSDCPEKERIKTCIADQDQCKELDRIIPLDSSRPHYSITCHRIESIT